MTILCWRCVQAEEKAPEKLAFDLKLVGFDEKSKIKVIKEVRVISGLGLKEVSPIKFPPCVSVKDHTYHIILRTFKPCVCVGQHIPEQCCLMPVCVCLVCGI